MKKNKNVKVFAPKMPTMIQKQINVHGAPLEADGLKKISNVKEYVLKD